MESIKMPIKVLLRDATLEDSEQLLAWRNDELSRLSSHNTEKVSAEEHKSWLIQVLQNPKRKLYIAEWLNDVIGTVRADYRDENKSWELSWTLSPQKRGKGLAKHMVLALTHSIKQAVSAEIKQENKASIHIAEFSGLKLSHMHHGVLHFYRPGIDN